MLIKQLPVPFDLTKLREVVKLMLLKKMYIMVRKKNIEDQIPEITNVTNNASINAKINEVEGVIPSITNSSTNASLHAK